MVSDCVSNAKAEPFLSKRTVKILVALTQKTKIVSSDWVIQSILAKEILSDSSFVAKGIVVNDHLLPFKTSKSLEGLFDKMKFHIKNGTNPMITRHNLLRLILNCGGTIVDDIDSATMTISMTEKATADSNGSLSVNYLYVIDCITLNEIRSTDNYRY